MHHVPARHRTTAATVLAALVATLGVALAVLFGTNAAPAEAQTTPGKVTTVVVRLTGEMRLNMDKNFLKTIKRSGATVAVKSGAKYSGKKRTATLPIDSTGAVSFDPATADILAKGTVMLRRKDGRKVTLQDVTLRIRDTGADIGSTVRGRPNRQFAALTVSPTIAINPTQSGASFVDLQMLVSEDLAKAAKKAKIKGVKEGALLGLMSAEVAADLPSFQLPSISLPGLDGGSIPGLPSIPGLTG